MSADPPVIELAGVRKEYDDVVAVDSIDLAIDEGEFFSLLGPSGCGKTTTLRMISGLETPTSGTVLLFGDDVTGVAPQDRATNLVFQNLALFPHMTVEENIRFALKHEDLTADERDDRIADMLEIVDMPGFQDRNVTQLSGGQQQRVALARSLAKEPAMLLLDEPLASLDRKLRQRMQFELKSIQEELGMTFFYVTHDQEVAMTMSDRMAVMRDGELVQVGYPGEIYERPANEFVADFIGDANFLKGVVVRQGDRSVVDVDGTHFPVTGDGIRDDATVVLRPENITIGPAADDTEYTFEGRVVERINQGHIINFTVELSDGAHLTVKQKERSVNEGDVTTVGFDRDDYSVVNA